MIISNYYQWLVYGLGFGQIRLFLPSSKDMGQRIKDQIVYYSYVS